MILKFLKPITNSQRYLIRLNYKHLNKKPIVKTKIIGLKNSSGRNHSGKITVKHKGNGHKQRYREIDFKRNGHSDGIVCSIEYDPNRNANIASIYDFLNYKFFYILAPEYLRVGDIVRSGPNVPISLGNSLPLSSIPEGSYIYNVMPKESKNAQLARSAGTYAILLKKTLNYVVIKLRSGEYRKVSPKCYASLGVVSNDLFFFTRNSKAGHSRWLNKRPTVRGVAMNPVDHPHGGGEGKKSGKNLTPWGKPNNKGKTSRSKNNLKVEKYELV